MGATSGNVSAALSATGHHSGSRRCATTGGVLNVGGGVARLCDRRLQVGHGHRRQRVDGRLLGGEVDRRARHARDLQKRFLDPPDAGRAGHAVYLQLHPLHRHVVARLAHGGGEHLARHARLGLNGRLLGCEVDADMAHAGDCREAFLDPRDARGTGHAGHLQLQWDWLGLGGAVHLYLVQEFKLHLERSHKGKVKRDLFNAPLTVGSSTRAA